jgi:nitroimidazol reductase NimA-like FMN-containing flavoprotein (pyridoxamine 5'-phosphate oxidase superfamily)
MQDKNQVTLIGSVERVEFTVSQAGKPFLRLTIKTETGQYASYNSVIAFGAQAEDNKELKQGDRVEMLGNVRRTKNKQTQAYETTIFVDMLKSFGGNQANHGHISGDDIPF